MEFKHACRYNGWRAYRFYFKVDVKKIKRPGYYNHFVAASKIRE